MKQQSEGIMKALSKTRDGYEDVLLRLENVDEKLSFLKEERKELLKAVRMFEKFLITHGAMQKGERYEGKTGKKT